MKKIRLPTGNSFFLTRKICFLIGKIRRLIGKRRFLIGKFPFLTGQRFFLIGKGLFPTGRFPFPTGKTLFLTQRKAENTTLLLTEPFMGGTNCTLDAARTGTEKQIQLLRKEMLAAKNLFSLLTAHANG